MCFHKRLLLLFLDSGNILLSRLLCPNLTNSLNTRYGAPFVWKTFVKRRAIIRDNAEVGSENGATKDALIEAMPQPAFYSGRPDAMTAIMIAKELF